MDLGHGRSSMPATLAAPVQCISGERWMHSKNASISHLRYTSWKGTGAMQSALTYGDVCAVHLSMKQTEGVQGMTEGCVCACWQCGRPCMCWVQQTPLASDVRALQRTGAVLVHLNMSMWHVHAGAPNTPHFRRQGASDDGSFLDIPSRPGPDSGLSGKSGQPFCASRRKWTGMECSYNVGGVTPGQQCRRET
eukprot:1139927-Pelagomonas_calceolata.AAC.8